RAPCSGPSPHTSPFSLLTLHFSPSPMPVHRPLDEELQILWDLLVQMHLLVDEQLADAIDAVTRCDADKAARVRDRDDEVDRLELEVDHQCERILALHTPVAVDLRLLVTAVKINTDLERIGDHAKNLAKYTPYLAGRSDLVEQAQLGRMADAARAGLTPSAIMPSSASSPCSRRTPPAPTPSSTS